MRSRTPIGALIGVLVAAIALGVGELVAAFVRPAAAPLIAVGNRLITLTPSSFERTATQSVGTSDKALLLGGICLLLAVVGAFVGSLALVRLRDGLIGVGVIGAFGVYCALSANASTVTDVIPTVVGTAAAMGVLVALVRVARARDDGPADAPPPLANRRLFLQGTVATAALAAATGFGGRVAQHATYDVAADRARVKLPPAKASQKAVPTGADLGKSGVAWRTSNADFYRIDTVLAVPQIATEDWRLTIRGMVDTPIRLSWNDLLRRPLVDRWITMCCVSNEVGGNLVSNALFRGVLLADLLREAGVQDGCDQLLMRSQDGMTIGAPTKVVLDGRAALLAVGMNGKPLPVEHGFPVRVVVPGLYGYVSACKWVVDIDCTTYARQAYWVAGGWHAQPTIKTSSRIDRPSSSQNVTVGETVAIAGVAWDQHVGISKVEVQVDDGPWKPARLATVPSTDTWRQWVYPWTPQKSGRYRLRVRATDAKGNVQDATNHEPFPSGSTGLHSVTVHALI